MPEPTTETENKSLTKFETPRPESGLILAPSNFELAQRMATALSKSNIIPQTFQNNLPNCLIALEMSNRMGIPAMMVMQNLYIVHGKPAWSSQFVIAAVNSTGRFSPLRFKMEGEGDKQVCTAWAIELATKEKLEGPPVSIDMAKKEGWYGKNGSKWQTMPELMLRYRSATFFGRLYAPEVLMGMREEGEIIDVETTAVAAPIAEPTGLPEKKDEPNAKPGRGKKEKTASAARTSAIQSEIEAKLKAAGYTPEQLIRLAVINNWTETTTKTLEEMGEDKVKVFLDDWPATEAELAKLKAGKLEE